MDEQDLTLHYQPVVSLTTGTTRGFEALIRREGGLVSNPAAEEIISSAEANGLMVPLGDWILRRALADARSLHGRDMQANPFVSVNVSASQLRAPGFPDAVRDALSATGTDPHRLVLEITENLLMTEDEPAWADLAELRVDGVRVAIDDYGTGYASLSYLRQTAIDVVKIDRSFLRDVSSPRSLILLDAVISLAARLGLDQVAEGVEDARTHEALIELGCQNAQGNFYAPAMPLAEASAWCEARAGQRPGTFHMRRTR